MIIISKADNIYSKAINNNEFDRVLWAISKENFETNKMRSAEQMINCKLFYNGTAKTIVTLIQF